MDDAVKMLLCTAAVAVLWLYKNVNGFLFCIILIMVLLMFFYLQSTEQHNKPQHPTRQSERRTITDMKYNLDHPLVRVWLPDEDNKYGHVSLQTNKYYMSFWPQKSSRKKSDIEKLLGAPACIIFHPDFDCKEEGNRFPDHKLPVTIATCSDMDRLYERFLAYNGIDKEEVNLNKGCNIRNRDELANRRIEEDLDKTRYTFLPKLCYKNEEPFYRSGQSCVSFVYHMIEWSKYSDSKTVKIEFFGKLFKFLDKVTASFPLEPPKREVYVMVWMHTVDGRIVQGVEVMVEIS
ncbi:uncharacterized protein LOC130695570 isoform X2 [Daphnia carinata]|uniref:uncharacterized protein LOC130695570 isoform X2 n=1 Tax=Daphnia carinata TaxID=120202 RepID=UPI002868C646|nr:uncharacterized protein LOC130695570 isoform X2 [Daphnia carinata]